MNRHKMAAVGGATALALLLSACGGGETDSTSPGTNDNQASGDDCSIAPILEEVEGLDADARADKLKDLAADESKEIQIYGSLGADEVDAIVADFSKQQGVKITTFSANSEEVLQRLGSEEQAGRTQGDIFENNGTELQLASQEGLLAQVTSPHAEALAEEVVYPTWVGNRYNVFTVLLNPAALGGVEPPKTYGDLADPKYDGLLGVEAGNWDHFATMVKYMQEKEGMSEEEAIDVWRDITSGARVFTSNTPLAEGVEQGELGAGITYNHYYSRFVGRGSKNIQWEPAIEPQVLRPNGVGIPCSAPNPATALLLFDFFISKEGQEILGEVSNRDVTHPEVKAGLLPGTDYEKVYMDLREVISESDKWVPIWDELIRNASK